MAAMFSKLFGLALASGTLCPSPRHHVREMVCGTRVNLDLPVRRLRMEWNEHKQSKGEERERGGVSDNSGGGILLHLHHSCTLFKRVHECVRDPTLSHRAQNPHPWQDAHILLIGSAQVLWAASSRKAKMECEMLHLPSCSAKLCFRGRWKSYYVTCLAWPLKL